MALRFLHTSDVHLGRSFRYLGERAPTHQQRLKQALERVYQIAQEQQCNAVLIAGDLFDHPRVGREWVDFALNLITSASCPTLVIAGNHDPAERHPFRERTSLPQKLHFFASTDRKRLPALEMEVVACPAGDESRWQAVLHRDSDGAPYQIALMHGSMPSAGEGTIPVSTVRQCGLDYVALGDWHSPQDFSHELGVPCWYSGAPEMIMPTQRLPAVALLVELHNSQPPQITPLHTGSARYPAESREDGTLEIALEAFDSPQSLLEALAAHLQETTVARIRLVGRWHADTPLDPDALQESLQSRCLWLEIDPAFQSAPLAPQTPFERALTQVYEARKAQGAPSTLDEAYQLALYLLRGGRL